MALALTVDRRRFDDAWNRRILGGLASSCKSFASSRTGGSGGDARLGTSPLRHWHEHASLRVHDAAKNAAVLQMRVRRLLKCASCRGAALEVEHLASELRAQLSSLVASERCGAVETGRVRRELRRIIDDVVPRVEQRHPTVSIQVEVEKEASLRSVPIELGTVLENLVDNAMSHGSGQRPARLEAWADARLVVIAVSNARASGGARRHGASRAPGLGAGLGLVAKMVLALGGSFSLVGADGEVRAQVALQSVLESETRDLVAQVDRPSPVLVRSGDDPGNRWHEWEREGSGC